MTQQVAIDGDAFPLRAAHARPRDRPARRIRIVIRHDRKRRHGALAVHRGQRHIGWPVLAAPFVPNDVDQRSAVRQIDPHLAGLRHVERRRFERLHRIERMTDRHLQYAIYERERGDLVLLRIRVAVIALFQLDAIAQTQPLVDRRHLAHRLARAFDREEVLHRGGDVNRARIRRAAEGPRDRRRRTPVRTDPVRDRCPDRRRCGSPCGRAAPSRTPTARPRRCADRARRSTATEIRRRSCR